MSSHVHAWTQAGRVSLWYYTESVRRYPGWHLNVDAAGGHSLITLLEALSRDGDQVFRTVHITPPSDKQLRVPNNQSGLAAWRAHRTLRVAFSSHPATWSFSLHEAKASLTLGSDWLAPLREGISGIARGQGDYAIGSTDAGSVRLWFWW